MSIIHRCALFFWFVCPLFYSRAFSFRYSGYSDSEENESYRVINRSDNDTSIYDGVCEDEKCFAKCCPEGQIFNRDELCENSNLKINFSQIGGIYRNKDCDLNNLTGCKQVDPHNYDNYYNIIVQGKPYCSADCIQLDTNEFKLLDSGSIFLIYEGSLRNITTNCIELHDNSTAVFPISLLCLEERIAPLPVSQHPSHNHYGMLASVAFLMATFLVYAILPDLRNLHGCSLMNHCAALGTAYFFDTILQMDVNTKIPEKVCVVFCKY